MAKIGDMVNLPRCKECGRHLKDTRHALCDECFQRQSSTGRSAGFDEYLQQLRDPGVGYFDASRNLHVRLVIEDAEAVAKMLADRDISAGQLRRFFTMARSLEQQLDSHGDFGRIRAGVAKLVPGVAVLIGREQDAGRRDGLERLKEFMEANVALALKGEREFREGFLPHFESVVAYFTSYKPR